MVGFIPYAVARMPAAQEGGATPARLVLAGSFAAASLSVILDVALAEPALLLELLLLELLASEPYVIRLALALGTKVVAALGTPHSVLTHMFGCGLVDVFAVFFLEPVVQFALQHLDGVAALAPDQVLTALQHFFHHPLLQLFVLFLPHGRSYLEIL